MTIEIIPKSADFKGLSLITGFHGIGATGYWAVKYLIQKLGAQRVGVVDFGIATPMTTTEEGRIATPYELFRKGNLVFFKVETPPYKNEDMFFFREFADFIVDSGFKETALIGGLDSRLKNDKTTFRLVKTSAYKPDGELADAKLLDDGQIIVGPVAVMLNRLEMRNFPAYSVLAYASVERLDPRATAAAIDVLSEHYGFEVDVTQLLKGAEFIDAEITRQESQIKKQTDNIYT